LKEEDRKDKVTKVNEEERSSEEEVIRRRMRTEASFLSILLTTSLPLSFQSSSSLPLSLLPFNLPHHLSILHSSQSATSLPLFSFL
jgi:hypothetical protein